MKVAILIPVLTSKDAVGADALAMAAILEGMGVQVRIFCLSASGVERTTFDADELPHFAGGPGDMVIYHYSTGWPLALDLLRRCRGLRIVKYHNITPPEYFEGYSDDYRTACEAGRRELEQVAALGFEMYLGDSAYNLEELIAAGAPRERGYVLPPFHRVAEIVDAEADLALVDQLNDGARNFLMVGRVAPNKGHLDLVDAFDAYVQGYSNAARLVLLGKADPRLNRYTGAIRDRVDELGLGDRVLWIDSASEAQLKAAYLTSRVFMILSRHEGFCVPLIEAMALGTPIVAHAASAVPETLGDAGILWGETDPWLYASSAARLCADDGFRNSLLDNAHRRYREHYSVEVLTARFRDLLGPLL
jgi:glycosyltransferase involved in cell wall biosynthesis